MHNLASPGPLSPNPSGSAGQKAHGYATNIIGSMRGKDQSFVLERASVPSLFFNKLERGDSSCARGPRTRFFPHPYEVGDRTLPYFSWLLAGRGGLNAEGKWS